MWPRASNHFVRPVVYRFFVIDLFPESPDERTWRPDDSCILLLGKHLVQQRHEPVLELAVVIVGHDQVSDAIHASPTKIRSVHIEIGEVRLAEAFYEVLFNPSRCCDKRRNVFMLNEVQDYLAKPRGDQIGSVTEEHAAFCPGSDFGIFKLIWLSVRPGFVRETPLDLLNNASHKYNVHASKSAYHFVDDLDRLS